MKKLFTIMPRLARRRLRNYSRMLFPGNFPAPINKDGYYPPILNNKGDLVCPMCGQASLGARKSPFDVRCHHCNTHYNYHGIMGLKPTEISLIN